MTSAKKDRIEQPRLRTLRDRLVATDIHQVPGRIRVVPRRLVMAARLDEKVEMKLPNRVH
ncbi:MAG: hypothetical protein CL566_06875 [Alphaproteobacteria bacterium]|nr:hypothetical protein [Alphaproteobacteria bacterium]|tara:strand:- start:981 stop:1160 length:180 start_codon:yes stop_codon:yes gene_type:complete